jgi:hypothetical protein
MLPLSANARKAAYETWWMATMRKVRIIAHISPGGRLSLTLFKSGETIAPPRELFDEHPFPP